MAARRSGQGRGCGYGEAARDDSAAVRTGTEAQGQREPVQEKEDEDPGTKPETTKLDGSVRKEQSKILTKTEETYKKVL